MLHSQCPLSTACVVKAFQAGEGNSANLEGAQVLMAEASPLVAYIALDPVVFTAIRYRYKHPAVATWGFCHCCMAAWGSAILPFRQQDIKFCPQNLAVFPAEVEGLISKAEALRTMSGDKPGQSHWRCCAVRNTLTGRLITPTRAFLLQVIRPPAVKHILSCEARFAWKGSMEQATSAMPSISHQMLLQDASRNRWRPIDIYLCGTRLRSKVFVTHFPRSLSWQVFSQPPCFRQYICLYYRTTSTLILRKRGQEQAMQIFWLEAQTPDLISGFAFAAWQLSCFRLASIFWAFVVLVLINNFSDTAPTPARCPVRCLRGLVWVLFAACLAVTCAAGGIAFKQFLYSSFRCGAGLQ